MELELLNKVTSEFLTRIVRENQEYGKQLQELIPDLKKRLKLCFVEDEDDTKIVHGPVDPKLHCPLCKTKLEYLRMENFCPKCQKIVYTEKGVVKTRDI